MLPKDRAILDLKLQRDKLKQYQKKIQLVLDKEVEVAKHHLRAGDQGRALLALKKKKYQERLLKQTDDQLFTLEQLTGQIEYSLVEQDVMKGLQQGNEILTMIHKEMSLDAVQRLMDDTADGIAYQAEINDLISGSISAEDEDEIMAQLDLLEAEEVRLVCYAYIIPFPGVRQVKPRWMAFTDGGQIPRHPRKHRTHTRNRHRRLARRAGHPGG
ncbi:Snf7-domain-containing protein [Fimicolochytrium jonesii]|uniref:Snf7-domain-containing protein n=1 Tax=Fimicolochytrium jonesii TaxID=1396493 RepID=UPI0022FF0CB3|nr:Snf7-domain-containing protein [Fimicolochytrium jonesii]KAI8817336.1 Snf7-domain-containing protein [Fimicolochytrium jonesii]